MMHFFPTGAPRVFHFSSTILTFSPDSPLFFTISATGTLRTTLTYPSTLERHTLNAAAAANFMTLNFEMCCGKRRGVWGK